jgi:orotate phosphoribosyltransferase
MNAMQKEFVDFMLEKHVLKFGDFITKSGRPTPYFINTGCYDDGSSIARIGAFYADCLHEHIKDDFDILYGPAYKGIPLATTTAIALSQRHNINVNYSFNRKEAKDHGEGGNIVGRIPQSGDKVVIVEDVITAGTSIRESIAIMNKLGKIDIVGIIVSVDRMERGSVSDKTAINEIEDQFGIPVFPVVNIKDVATYIHDEYPGGSSIIDDAMIEKIHNRIVVA